MNRVASATIDGVKYNIGDTVIVTKVTSIQGYTPFAIGTVAKIMDGFDIGDTNGEVELIHNNGKNTKWHMMSEIRKVDANELSFIEWKGGLP